MKNIRVFCVLVLALGSVIALPIGGVVFAQQPDPDGVYELGNGVTAPKAVFRPGPEYTDRARKKNVNGTVVVTMIVTPEGTVRDATVAKSLDKDLDKQALAAVSAWKFEPALKDGRPVAVHLTVEVNFSIH